LLQKKIKVFFKITIVPYILYFITKIIYYTNKKNFHFPKTRPKEPFIAAFWHGRLLMQPYLFKKFQPLGKYKAMISHHSDGESIAKMVNHLGVDSVRGSSSQGGVKALISAIKELKSNSNIAITPDGPRGPIYSIADGIIALSQKTNSDIYYFSYKASKYWQLKSWDKFIIPKPFGTIDFFVSEPFSLKGLTKEEARELIKSKMKV
jgi:lysophospholipid acyltransferase (LPLAT)-like uncharacterized protein